MTIEPPGLDNYRKKFSVVLFHRTSQARILFLALSKIYT